jgi:hypothetical protein
VIAAVAFARTHDLLVAVRGGDHEASGILALSPRSSTSSIGLAPCWGVW